MNEERVSGTKAPLTASLTRHDVVVVPQVESQQESMQTGQLQTGQLQTGQLQTGQLQTDNEQVGPEWRMYRFPVNAGCSHVYTKQPVELTHNDLGVRKLRAVLSPSQQPREGQPRRGPAFAVLPTKEDPTAQFGTCYVVNAEHFSAGNPWTWAAWNDGPDGAEEVQASNPWNTRWDRDEFELLVAGPRGQVFRIVKEPGKDPHCAEQVELSRETEVWAQLREGVVVGTVCLGRDKRVVPLVNVTALTPSDKGELP